jgi:hypothetical protein
MSDPKAGKEQSGDNVEEEDAQRDARRDAQELRP